MITSERLTPREQEMERKPGSSAAESTLLSRDRIDAVIETRSALLAEVEAALSPLMHRALHIKLASEKDALEALLAEAAKRAHAERRRQGVLDTQLFKKKRLGFGTSARRNSVRTNSASKNI